MIFSFSLICIGIILCYLPFRHSTNRQQNDIQIREGENLPPPLSIRTQIHHSEGQVRGSFWKRFVYVMFRRQYQATWWQQYRTLVRREIRVITLILSHIVVFQR